jgi:hypothetical protein
MAVRRVVRGRFLNGSGGIRISLPPYDALLDDSSDPRKFSLDSDWPDLVKIHMAGVGSKNASADATVPFAELGYKPFVEIRAKVGATVYDDSLAPARVGIGASIFSNRLVIPTVLSGVNAGSYDFVYVVYKVATLIG